MANNDLPPATPFDGPRRLPRFDDVTPEQWAEDFVDLFGETFESLSECAMRYALSLTRGNTHDAGDLVQDALVRILKRTYDERISRPRPFMRTVVLRLHLDVLERRNRERDLGDRVGFDVAMNEDGSDRTAGDVADSVSDSLYTHVFSAEIRDRLSGVEESLGNDDQRTVLHALLDLTDGELRSVKDIAKSTGFSESKVKRLRAALLRLLRDALTELDERADPNEVA